MGGHLVKICNLVDLLAWVNPIANRIDDGLDSQTVDIRGCTGDCAIVCRYGSRLARTDLIYGSATSSKTMSPLRWRVLLVAIIRRGCCLLCNKLPFSTFTTPD
jgi:hypothetical protein